jgi:hypothetical protein
LLESLCRSSNSSFLKLFLSYSRRRLTESDTIHSKNNLRKSLRAFSGQLIAELIFQNWQVQQGLSRKIYFIYLCNIYFLGMSLETNISTFYWVMCLKTLIIAWHYRFKVPLLLLPM